MSHPTLKFSCNNRKLSELAEYLSLPKSQVIAFDLPAGFTCPRASLCQAYSNRKTGKITRGPSCQFLCYAAKLEAAFPSVRNAHWHNFDLIKACGDDIDEMVELIDRSLPRLKSGQVKAKVVRIHASGDYFSYAYFLAWARIADRYPQIDFFGYTKILNYVLHTKPANFTLVYSYGGKDDNSRDLDVRDIPTCYVICSAEDNARYNVPIACETSMSPDDYDYIKAQKSFGINFH